VGEAVVGRWWGEAVGAMIGVPVIPGSFGAAVVSYEDSSDDSSYAPMPQEVERDEAFCERQARLDKAFHAELLADDVVFVTRLITVIFAACEEPSVRAVTLARYLGYVRCPPDASLLTRATFADGVMMSLLSMEGV